MRIIGKKNYLNSFSSTGIVPMFCAELFKGIQEKGNSGTTFEVKFSMLEIYNEEVQDLTISPN